jgi:hypothetical protein
MGKSCSRHERDKKYIQNFNIDPELKSILGRPRRTWKVTIKLDNKVVVCEDVNPSHLGEDMVSSWGLVNPIIYTWVL